MPQHKYAQKFSTTKRLKKSMVHEKKTDIPLFFILFLRYLLYPATVTHNKTKIKKHPSEALFFLQYKKNVKLFYTFV